MTDERDHQFVVHFNNFGQALGFPGFSEYHINSDFAIKSENNLDILIFDINTNHQKTFGYKINGDTVNLYNVSLSDENIKLNFDELVYKLLKDRS